jgi:chromosome segregation ATPase
MNPRHDAKKPLKESTCQTTQRDTETIPKERKRDLRSIKRICEKYERKAAGRYGTELAGRLLFALSRDVQAALDRAQELNSRREARIRELEQVCDEWQRSFQDISKHTQGIFGVVPMTPSAVSARLDQQKAHIEKLEADIQSSRRIFQKEKDDFQSILKMHQDAARRSASADAIRFEEQVKMMMTKQSKALAEQREARIKMETETREYLQAKESKDREIEALRSELRTLATENQVLKSEASNYEQAFDDAMQRARAESLVLMKSREAMWKHEFHSFQLEASASSEVDGLRSTVEALRRQLTSLSQMYKQDTKTLRERLTEEQFTSSSLRELLGTDN